MRSRSLWVGALTPMILAGCMMDTGPSEVVAQAREKLPVVEPWKERELPLWPDDSAGAVVIVTAGATDEVSLAFGVLPEQLLIQWVIELPKEEQGAFASINADEWRILGIDGMSAYFRGSIPGGPPPPPPPGYEVISHELATAVLSFSERAWSTAHSGR